MYLQIKKPAQDSSYVHIDFSIAKNARKHHQLWEQNPMNFSPF